MGERSQHDRNFLWIGQVIDQFTRAIDDQLRVREDVALGMPLRILLHPNQCVDLRKDFLQHIKIAQPLQSQRRML